MPAGVSAVLAVTLATISFFALAVLGLGMLSAATDADIIAVPGLGQLPGVVAMALGVAAFAAFLWGALQRTHPSFLSVPVVALTTTLLHLVGVWMSVTLTRGDVVVATVVAGDLVRGGASVVIMLAAAVAGWGGIALRRTRAQHPRWPWERDDQEE